MYVVLCLVDAFVKTRNADWRWWARRSAHNSGVHHGESADDREATDEREPAEDLMLGEPETALREETANDRVATAAGLASDMRAATAADKSLGTASTVREKYRLFMYYSSSSVESYRDILFCAVVNLRNDLHTVVVQRW